MNSESERAAKLAALRSYEDHFRKVIRNHGGDLSPVVRRLWVALQEDMYKYAKHMPVKEGAE